MTRSNALFKLAAAALLALPALGAAWTNRAEYDLVLTIRAEAAPQKKLALLDQWTAKYPNTPQKQVRRELYISTYEALGDSVKVLQTAQEILAEQADSFVGVYWSTVALPGSPAPTPAQLATGEKAAQQLLAGLDVYFGEARRPASIPVEVWQKQKAEAAILAHRALGWIHWRRGNFQGAEQELASGLKVDPNNAELSLWLGTVQALQKQPEKQVASMWNLARAASVREAGALPESQRRQVSALVEKIYVSYHGEPAGLDRLTAGAARSVTPPADFRIESAAELAERRRDEQLSRENPMLLEWLKIRRKLDAAEGEKFYAETLTQSPLPKLKGTVIRWSPEGKPDRVVLGLSSPAADEVTLVFESPFPNEPEQGMELQFEGAPASFSKTPFQLTVNVAKDKLEGWPAPAPKRK
jgi:tetratricopeptide (TPR) repeat protein